MRSVLLFVVSAAVLVSASSSGAGALPRVELGPPLWSPTRAELAFSAGFDERALCGVESGRDANAPPKRDVFIVAADGSGLRRLAPSDPYDWREDPQWAPDGTRLAVRRWTSSFGRVDRNGEVVTRDGHVEYSEIFAEPAGWAPDSQHLAITRFDPTDSPTDVVIRDLRTGDVWRLGRYGFGGVYWSPRGNLIAYAANGFVYTVRTDRTHRHRVIRAADVFALAWSGDGRLLVYEGADRRGYGPLYVVAPDGSGRQRVSERATTWSWSPRGRVLAIGRTLIDFVSHRRWSVLPRRVAGVPFPVWSPTGRNVAYVTRRGIYVVATTGRNGHLIRPPDVAASDPSWSRDGRTLAFATDRGLYKVNANGRNGGYIPLDWCNAATKLSAPSPRS